MKLDAILKPPTELASGRFFRTGYFPTLVALLFLLVLVWAGAPGRRIDFDTAWQTMSKLGVGEVLLLTLLATLIAMLVQPLQLGLIRVLEGRVPGWLGAGLARKWHSWRRGRWARKKVHDKINQAIALPDDKRVELVQSAGANAVWLRSRYPRVDDPVHPTALGNALAAAESMAGAAYGLDSVAVWPRLYPLLAEPVRFVVDDLRDGLDAAARLTATGLLTAVLTFGLLVANSGWWTLLTLIPLAIALMAYRGAVESAVAYGRALQVAFDLHRFDLLTALHMPSPKDIREEQARNRELSDFFRQGVPVKSDYVGASTVDNDN